MRDGRRLPARDLRLKQCEECPAFDSAVPREFIKPTGAFVGHINEEPLEHGSRFRVQSDYLISCHGLHQDAWRDLGIFKAFLSSKHPVDQREELGFLLVHAETKSCDELGEHGANMRIWYVEDLRQIPVGALQEPPFLAVID